MEKNIRDEATARVKDFYDGPADTIYKTTWGENLHLGFPTAAGGSQHEAMASHGSVPGRAMASTSA